jgi:PKD repeat protein
MRKTLNLLIALTVIFSSCQKEEASERFGPTASFDISTQKNVVTVVNTSQDGDDHLLDWGDGNKENIKLDAIAKHAYENLGSYEVMLTVSNPGGSSEMKRDIKITEKLENAEAVTNDFVYETPTKLTANFTLSDGNPLNPSEFKLQLSRDENFNNLEQISISQLDKVEELTLKITDDFWEFKNLIPGEKYYYRIHIENTDNESWSNVSEGNTYGIAEIGALQVGNSDEGIDVMFKASHAINDLDDDFLYEDYPEFEEMEFATDEDFNNVIEPLMVGNIQNNYYREAGTQIYVRATLKFKGKSHSYKKSLNTEEHVIAMFSDDTYLKSTSTEAKKNQKTIFLGDTEGEHIAIYNVPGNLNEKGEYEITSVEDERIGVFYLKYYDKDGKGHSIYATSDATLEIYRIDDSGNMFARILGYVGFENSKSLDGCVFKAKLQ